MDKNETESSSKKIWKIEGEAFDKVKAAKAERDAAFDETARIHKEAHNKFWDKVCEAVPGTNREEHLSIEVDYESAGFYVLKESEVCVKGLLGALLASVKAK